MCCWPMANNPPGRGTGCSIPGVPLHNAMLTAYNPNEERGDNILNDVSRNIEDANRTGDPEDELNFNKALISSLNGAFDKAIAICRDKKKCCKRVTIKIHLIPIKDLKYEPPPFAQTINCEGTLEQERQNMDWALNAWRSAWKQHPFGKPK